MSRTNHHGKRKWRKAFERWKWWRTPAWWTRMFMNRPKRVENRRLCNVALFDEDQGDGMVFPVGNNKPHRYYW